MLTADDLVRLPYDDSLTRAGIEYAKKSLHYTYDRMGLPAAARLRKIVAGVAVELAFRRWLEAQGARYDLLGATAFTEKDKYDLRLGGRRCDVKSFLISRKADIREMRRDPAWLLDAAALVPADQFAHSSLEEQDFYIFGFLAGLETRHSDDVKRAEARGQPLYLLHTLNDTAWLGRERWQPLGPLALKSNAREPVEIEVGGQDEARRAVVERLRLEPRVRRQTAQTFYSLLYLHSQQTPSGVIGVHSPGLKDTRLIAPPEWQNVWVYGLEVFLAGWLTRAEFRRRSRKLAAGSRVRQYPRTQTANRAAPVKRLWPIAELAGLVKGEA